MSKVAIQGNASGTGTFTIAAPNSNTDRTLTLPDEAGTVLTSASTVSATQATNDAVVFSAKSINADQQITNASWTKVNFGTEDIDSHGYFANSTFTPQVAGWYNIGATVRLNMNGEAPNDVYIVIYKNGSQFYMPFHFQIGSGALNNGSYPMGSTLVYFNGSTDYIEIYAYMATMAGSGFISDVNNYLNASSFHGFLVRAD
jgi:hypothetical protein